MKYVSTSDNHWCHRRTPTKHMVANFKKYILTEENKDIEILFIAGDLFDREITANNEDFLDALEGIRLILAYCAENDIKLRVLEGTPRHDQRQPRVINPMNEAREKKVDFKYFDKLDIEYIEDLNKYVLYIPDEWSNSHEDVERQISEKLLEHNINQVDIAIIHGFFQYQLLGVPFTGFSYKEEYFLNLVKGFIHFGHVHKHSHFDRIISNNSLDRLAHNEEDDKGYVRVNGDQWEYVVNHDAWTYKTLRLTKNDTYETLDRKIYQYKEGSYIQLAMSRDHPFNSNFLELKLRYPDYNLKKKTDDASEKNLVTHIVSDIEYTEVDFISVNLRDLIKTGIKAKNEFTESQLKKIDGYLEIFKGSETTLEETKDV